MSGHNFKMSGYNFRMSGHNFRMSGQNRNDVYKEGRFRMNMDYSDHECKNYLNEDMSVCLVSAIPLFTK